MQHSSRWMRKIRLAGLILVFMITGITVAQPALPQVEPSLTPGTFHVTATEHELSLAANEAPVAAIFAEIGRQTGIPVIVHAGVHETITIAFDRVPLSEALTRLAKNVVIRTAQGPSALPHQIAKVYVLAVGQARPPQGDGGPTQPQTPIPTDAQGQDRKPAAVRPAPFQFTFDPSQHVQQSP